ncbi:MAG: hypothetical protein LBR23_00630 [Spirochaetaceae bacterium]|nr:hypothetical protein [Spirochaetaceae bacterium]
MTIEQTVEIPASRRVSFDLPASVPVGRVRIKLNIAKPRVLTPLTEAEMEAGAECPICKAHNYTPNAETIEAIEEGDAIVRGEIPSKEYHSAEEFLRDLRRGI